MISFTADTLPFQKSTDRQLTTFDVSKKQYLLEIIDTFTAFLFGTAELPKCIKVIQILFGN